MTSSDKTRVTAEEYFSLPETMMPTQLIDGDIIVSLAPDEDHQNAVLRLGSTFLTIADREGGRAFIAPFEVYFDEFNIPQPDVMYVVPDSKCEVSKKRLIGAPDLIVEMVSP